MTKTTSNSDEEIDEVSQYVFEAEELHYWSGLYLVTRGPSSVTDKLIAKAKVKIPPGMVLQDSKSCTAQCTMIIIRYTL